jgi:hypothetical protein
VFVAWVKGKGVLTTRRSRGEHLQPEDKQTRPVLCAPQHDRHQAEHPLHVFRLFQQPPKFLNKCPRREATAATGCSRPRRPPGREQGVTRTTAQGCPNHPRLWRNVRLQCVSTLPFRLILCIYAQQPEALASTVFSRMITESRSSRENWREFQRVYSNISLVRDCSISLIPMI